MRRRDVIALFGSALVAAPLAARAQQKAMPMVGYISGRSLDDTVSLVAAFRQGLGEAGFVEGQNVAIEYRWAEGHYDRYPALAADLVSRKVEVITTVGGITAALAAKNATSTIPIVFFIGVDPVSAGLVSNLARPGGNLTGASIQLVELAPKRLELLSELVPQARMIVLLINPNNSGAEHLSRALQEAARAKEVQSQTLNAATEGEIDVAFTTFAQLHAGAFLVGDDPFLASRREQIVSLTSRYAVPAIFPDREFVTSGGLISYAPRFDVAFRLVGTYAGRVMKGEKPGNLPVQQPTAFELVINLKTAKALGLAVPQSLLARADEMIE